MYDHLFSDQHLCEPDAVNKLDATAGFFFVVVVAFRIRSAEVCRSFNQLQQSYINLRIASVFTMLCTLTRCCRGTALLGCYLFFPHSEELVAP